ncbi:MAG: desulfoferrodoxin family protein [Candidatus Hodarchaeales archaeon]|jgi:superoxide reductase
MSDKEELFKEINRIKDPDNMTDLEKKHDITVIAPDVVKTGEVFEVELRVGERMTHPNMPGHFIQFIELFSGDSLVSRYEMAAATISSPIVKIKLQLPEWASPVLVARERCNLHGIWEAKKEIRIE